MTGNPHATALKLMSNTVPRGRAAIGLLTLPWPACAASSRGRVREQTIALKDNCNFGLHWLEFVNASGWLATYASRRRPPARPFPPPNLRPSSCNAEALASPKIERCVCDRERPRVFAPAWHLTDVARPNTGTCNIPPASGLRPTALMPASRGTGSLADLLGQAVAAHGLRAIKGAETRVEELEY